MNIDVSSKEKLNTNQEKFNAFSVTVAKSRDVFWVARTTETIWFTEGKYI